MSRIARLVLVCVAAVTLTGCLLPKGPKVIVDRRGGESWSGNGILVDRSADGRQCRVAIRSEALFVERRWVPCKYVHESFVP